MTCQQEFGSQKQHYRKQNEGQESQNPLRSSGFRFLQITERRHSMKFLVFWNDSASEVSEMVPLKKKTITKTKTNRNRKTNIKKCSYKEIHDNKMAPSVAVDSFRHYARTIIYPHFQNHFNINLGQNQEQNSNSCDQPSNQVQISLNPLISSDRQDQENQSPKSLSTKIDEYLSQFNSGIALPFNNSRLIQQTLQFQQQQLKVTETMEKLFTCEVKKVFEKFITSYRPPYKLKRSNSKQFQDISSNSNPSSSSSSSNSTNNSDFHKTNNQSNYHNMKSQLMYCLVNLFQSQILNCFNLPNHHVQQILKIISRIKENSNTISRYQTKYQHFSNLHFEALFLTITPQSIESIKQSQIHLQMNQQIFNQDLSNSTGSDAQAIYCNFYKSFIFQISLISLNTIEEIHSKDSQGDHYFQQKNTKHESRFSYLIRAREGMTKLSQGKAISRF